MNRLIMRRHEHQASERHVYFQFGQDDDETRQGYYMTRVAWDMHGNPDIIAVSVEPIILPGKDETTES